MDNKELHQNATERFISLANEMKDDGLETNVISAALMSASAIYATYTAAGNNGVLQPSGVDKVAEIYRANLAHIQKRKREELEDEMD